MNVLKELINDSLLVLIGSLVGGAKASTYINKDQKLCEKLIDLVVGVFCGVVAGMYFQRDYGMFVAGITAIAAGAAGAIVLETCIELLPSLLKQYIRKKTK